MVSWQYRVFSHFIKWLPLKFTVQLLFFRRFKRWPNLEKPVTLNEKLNWRKLYEHEPIFTIAADKLASKEFIAAICPSITVPKTLWQGTDFSSLPDSTLPERFVIKANHGSRMNLFFDKTNRPNFIKLEKNRKSWFQHDQFSTLGEWGYKNIIKRVFVEEFLDFGGKNPDDYKFFVFHGKVHFIQLDTGRFEGHHRNIYTPDWQDTGIAYAHDRVVPSPPKPELLDVMVAAAEQIGEYFSFVRVDLYQLNGQVYFGELTLYPGAGYEVFPTEAIDTLFGQPWNINKRASKKYE